MTLVFGGALIGSAAPPRVGAAVAAPRIISLSPHITELLFAAGAGDRIVGVDDSSDYPPAVAAIPRVGEPTALDVEGLLKLKPTLIVLWESGDAGEPQGRAAAPEIAVVCHRSASSGRYRLDTARIRPACRNRDRGGRGRPKLPGGTRAAAFAICRTRTAQGFLPRCGTGRCTPCRGSTWSAKYCRYAAVTTYSPIFPPWRRLSTRRRC
jgi:hypothetical protein